MRFGPLCFLTIRGFRPIIGPAVFALLVTTSCTLLSFFLCCHLCCCFHRCYCFPHLESKRAKETDLLPCLQGTEIVLPPSLRYWIGAGSRIQVGVIGISKKLPLVFRVSIVKTIERRVRWTGKKIILSRHRTCEPALAEQSNFSRRNLIQVCLKKNDSSMVKQTKLFALPKFGSLRGSTSASLKIGENLAIRKKLASFWNWGSHLFYVTWWQIYYLCKQNWLKFALVRPGP